MVKTQLEKIEDLVSLLTSHAEDSAVPVHGNFTLPCTSTDLSRFTP